MFIGMITGKSTNLTAITWKHDVNSHESLEKALRSKFALHTYKMQS